MTFKIFVVEQNYMYFKTFHLGDLKLAKSKSVSH